MRWRLFPFTSVDTRRFVISCAEAMLLLCVVSIRLACFTMISSNRFYRFTSFCSLASFSHSFTHSLLLLFHLQHIPYTICVCVCLHFENQIMQCINVPLPVNIILHTSCLMKSIHFKFVHPSKRFSFLIHFTHMKTIFAHRTVVHLNMNEHREFMKKNTISPQSRLYHHHRRRHSFRCHTFLEKSIQPNHVSTHITTSKLYILCISSDLFSAFSTQIDVNYLMLDISFSHHLLLWCSFFSVSISHWVQFTAMHVYMNLYFRWCSAN